MSYEDLPEPARKLFNATMALNRSKQKTRQDNSEIRKRRARVEEIKNKKTYKDEG